MSTVSVTGAAIPQAQPRSTYLNISYTARSWLLTTDHKRIAILYAVSIPIFFFFGALAASLMRVELISPTGLIVAPATYNKLFTLHSVIMVWFFLIPSIRTSLGNSLIPLIIGWRHQSFHHLNLRSW